MPLNLISDSWIPVRDRGGVRRTIAPWQMADAGLLRPDWPRPDLNLGCLELLIGLVFLADPPADDDEWDERQVPDPDRLRDRLAAYAPAFELTGDGPSFLQDLDPLVGNKRNPPEMLFIDSAGQQTEKNNADLMVHRNRYKVLAPDMAAMALYTLQAHAPAGGKGNRTSMRGGGPMVTLVDPSQGLGLWPLIWANVPYGKSADLDALPWMKPTPTSEKKGSERGPGHGHPVEAFFGMPRRLRLMEKGGNIVGAIQRPYGVNYAGWVHPLTPYYRQKEGAELLPKHPRPGRFGYRNWLGIVATDSGTLAQRAAVVRDWSERSNNARAQLIVAGWAMDNMKPLDFSWSTPPLVNLPEDATLFLSGLIQAADTFGSALRKALKPMLDNGETLEAMRERFFHETQDKFEERLTGIAEGKKQEEIARTWVCDLRLVALRLFEAFALPGLADREASMQKRIVAEHRLLGLAFAGYGKDGARAYGVLGLEPVERKKGERAV